MPVVLVDRSDLRFGLGRGAIAGQRSESITTGPGDREIFADTFSFDRGRCPLPDTGVAKVRLASPVGSDISVIG